MLPPRRYSAKAGSDSRNSASTAEELWITLGENTFVLAQPGDLLIARALARPNVL